MTNEVFTNWENESAKLLTLARDILLDRDSTPQDIDGARAMVELARELRLVAKDVELAKQAKAAAAAPARPATLPGRIVRTPPAPPPFKPRKPRGPNKPKVSAINIPPEELFRLGTQR